MVLPQVGGSDFALHLSGVADGAAFMLQSALALAAALATVLAAEVGRVRRPLGAAAVFVVVAAASARLPQAIAGGMLVPGVMLVLGVVVAAGMRLRGTLAWLSLVLGGVAAGIAGGLQTATWEETLGGVLVLVIAVLTGFLVAARIALPPRLHRGASTARRTAGAWIAAIGVLMIALWVRKGG